MVWWWACASAMITLSLATSSGQLNDDYCHNAPDEALRRSCEASHDESKAASLNLGGGSLDHCATKLLYRPSAWEKEWLRDIAYLADSSEAWPKACSRLYLEVGKVDAYMQAWQNHTRFASPSQKWDKQTLISYFSVVDRRGTEVGQLPIEPLVGALRHPHWPCFSKGALMSKDWLFTSWSADHELRCPQGQGGRAFYFDIGCSTYQMNKFESSLSWFWRIYKSRGIRFDKIFAWEPDAYTRERIVEGMPEDMLARFNLFQHYASARIGDPLNPWTLLRAEAKKGDFVLVKLDIDTPAVENALVDQLLESQDLQDLVDEFLYEHHVRNNPLAWTGWLIDVQGSNVTIVDSYKTFRSLRDKGIRAHSWV